MNLEFINYYGYAVDPSNSLTCVGVIVASFNWYSLFRRGWLLKNLDLRQGYEGLLKLGSGWRYQKPPRYSIDRAAGDMKRVKELLFLPRDRIFRHRPGELRPWDNAVEKLHINISGGQGSGKGHTGRWISRWTWEKYQEDRERLEEARRDDTPMSPYSGEWGEWVSLGISCMLGEPLGFRMCDDPWFYAVKDAEKINELLLYGLDSKAEFQVVLAEDLTNTITKMGKKYADESASTWFKIRHKLRASTGHQEGLIIGILGLHRFHGVPPPFTTDIDLIIFKSLSTNPHDKRIIKEYVGNDGIQFLGMLEQERRNDPMFKGYGIWYHKSGEVGVWYNPAYPGSDPFEAMAYVEPVDGETPMLSKPGAQTPNKQPVTVGDYVVETLGSTEDQEFREEVISCLDLKRGDPVMAERDRQVLRLTVQGETQNTIGYQVFVSPSRAGQLQREIKENALGDAGEAAYSKRYPALEWIGGNKPEPDFIDHETKTVISFKTYHEPALRDTTKWICKRVGKEEMRYSQEHGYALEMLIYEMAQGRFFRYRYTPKDVKEPQDSKEQSAADEISMVSMEEIRNMDDREFVERFNRGLKIKALAEAGLLPEALLSRLPKDLRRELES